VSWPLPLPLPLLCHYHCCVVIVVSLLCCCHHVIVVVVIVISLLLSCCHCHCHCHVVIAAITVVMVAAVMVVVVATIMVVVVIATVTAVVITITTVFVVFVLLLHHCYGQTMVGVATSPSARSLEERGELQREVINENKKKILACTLVHVQLRDSATLSSHCGCHCHWTVAGPWRERMCTSVSKEGLRMGDYGELLSEIANEKKKKVHTDSSASRSSASYKASSGSGTCAKNPTLMLKPLHGA
jgi:hypothetical protein